MNLHIYFENSQDVMAVRHSLRLLVRRAIVATLQYEGVKKDCEVSVTFTDDEGIRALNRSYREIDRATDVLSFPLFEESDTEKQLGDIVISLERAEEQANEIGHSREHEAAFLTVHSVLHLLGYDHETGEEDERDMRQRQTAIVTAMGLGVK